jgi:hypothetical protein
MMKAAGTFGTSVNIYHTMRIYNPEDSHLHTHSLENLKYYLTGSVSGVYLLRETGFTNTQIRQF